MSNVKSIHQVIRESVGEYGFKKKSNSWFFLNSEVTQIINVQKSIYGEAFYINCGIGINQLEPKSFQKEVDCHIRARASSDVFMEDAEREEIKKLLDFSRDDVDYLTRMNKFKYYLDSYILPFFEKYNSLDEIFKAVREKRFSNIPVSREVYELAGISV